MRLYFFSSLFLVCSAASTGQHWSYIPQDGPVAWPKQFPGCAGTRQSPINIDTKKVHHSKGLKPFQFIRETSGPLPDFDLVNNGHTVSVKLPDAWRLTFENGGVHYCFKPLQMHWHWGSSNSKGSEHTIDGKACPLEGHLVTWNCRLYHDVSDAISGVNGLAVLGVLYMNGEGEEPDPVIEAVTRHFRNPTFRQCSCTNETDIPTLKIPGFDISTVLPQDTTKFYRYMGSLTTPPCTENVLWTVYKQKRRVTSAQMDAFRSLLYPTFVGVNQPMVNNYRPVTPLNPTSPVSTIRSVSASFHANNNG